MLSFLFKILVILFGASATANQIIFLREFFVTTGGNELFFAIIFSIWLLGVTAGGLVGAKFISKKDTVSPLKTPFFCELVLLLILFQSILSPPTISLIRILRLILKIPAGEFFPLITFIFSSTLLIVPYSFLIGFLFPLICEFGRLFLRNNNPQKNKDEIIGLIYTLESFGSAIGGLFISVFLIGKISSLIISFGIALIVSLNLNLLRISREKDKQGINNLTPLSSLTKYFPLLIFIVSCIIIFTNLGKKIDEITINLRWKAFGEGLKLIAYQDTPYQHLSLAQQANQFSLFSNGEFVSSFPDPYEDSLRANFFLCEHPKPKRVLLIGTGDEELLPWLLKFNIEKLTYIEADPFMHKFLNPFLSEEAKKCFSDKRLSAYHSDGRFFVKNLLNKAQSHPLDFKPFDIVILSLPEPSTISFNRFYTKDFFEEISLILGEDGVLVTSVSSSINYFGETILTYAGSIYKSLEAVFPVVLVTPGTKAFLIASKKENITTLNPATLGERYSSRLPDNEFFTKYRFLTFLQPTQVEFTKNSFKNLDPQIPINTDLSPVSHLFNLILWSKIAGTKSESFLRGIKGLSVTEIALLIFIPVFIIFLSQITLRRSRENKLRIGAMFIIISTGFFMMATEITILYLFQKNFGYLYQKIGLIVAIFMLGLAIGGKIAAIKPIKNVKAGISYLILVEIFIIIFALIFLLFLLQENQIERIMGIGILETIYFFAVGLCGMVGGVQFPYVGQILNELRKSKSIEIKNEKKGISAGLVEFADHLGAAGGAFLTGLILLPVTGIMTTVCILLFLKASSLIIFSTALINKK